MDDELYDALDSESFEDFVGDDAGEFDDFDSGEGDFDDFDTEDDIESFDDGDFGEGRRSRRARRMRAARRRRAMRRRLKRRQLARRRRRRPGRPRTAVRRIASNRANIQKVGLDSAVKSDTLAKGLSSQSKRIGGTEYAITASKVIDELTEQFPDLINNKLVKSGLPLAPLLFLKPPKRDGIQGVAMDPRVWGPVLVAGAALFNEFREKESEPREVTITPNNVFLPPKGEFQLNAVVRDQSGKLLSGRTINWVSTNSKAVNVDDVGKLTATTAGGNAMVVATDTDSGLTGSVTVRVE